MLRELSFIKLIYILTIYRKYTTYRLLSKMIDSPIIINNMIQMNQVPSDMALFQAESNSHFGLLTLKTAKILQSNTPVLFKFDIDISDSMGERGIWSTTKMEYVKNTFKNMMMYLSEQSAEIYVQVSLFNTNYKHLIDVTLITPDNCDELINKVLSITNSLCTNIERTFSGSAKFISEYANSFPMHRIAYVILTDGIATDGNQNIDYLVSIVPKNCDIFCIGYGQDHCAKLLRKCGVYYFVTDFEVTGKVYGEIVFTMLYIAVEDVEIRMTNGANIYDAFTNTWVDVLNVKQLYGDREITYALKCVSDTDNTAIITGKVVGTIESNTQYIQESNHLCEVIQLPDLIDENGTFDRNDLRKYMYKHKTQEYLFECIKLSDDTNKNRFENNIKIRDYKKDIQGFYSNIKQYIIENNLTEDTLLKVLCDDIYTGYKTIGRESSNTYTVMRQTAHAREMSYRAGTNDLEEQVSYQRQDIYQNMGSIGRQCSIECHDIDDEDEENDEDIIGDLNRYTSNTQPDEELNISETLTQTVRGVSNR